MPTRKFLRAPRHFVGRIPRTSRLNPQDLIELAELGYDEIVRRPRRPSPRRSARPGDER